eukprot:TRINITY_DN22868_c0_g1_i1.p1 TRINITY_DN22868_c0_g1~~TRINITY_DN22868_c0_g1_i1.p1  ORF type:complete len:176 (+),score=21.76 TRINITY_DN22868_c0_g1_i1:96-623(+)
MCIRDRAVLMCGALWGALAAGRALTGPMHDIFSPTQLMTCSTVGALIALGAIVSCRNSTAVMWGAVSAYGVSASGLASNTQGVLHSKVGYGVPGLWLTQTSKAIGELLLGLLMCALLGSNPGVIVYAHFGLLLCWFVLGIVGAAESPRQEVVGDEGESLVQGRQGVVVPEDALEI